MSILHEAFAVRKFLQFGLYVCMKAAMEIIFIIIILIERLCTLEKLIHIKHPE